MSMIELRLSDVDPPLPDPPRTIYRDVVNLPDPVLLGITVRYFNYDDVDLYFQITGSAPGYTFGTVNLGLLASGANAYINLDNFASRAKPSAGDFTNGEFEENITLILKAYTDAGYTNLKWTHERTVTVHWIKSDDPAWTQDVLNDFDDGSVQGWSAANEAGNQAGYPTCGVATDYVLSAPYSLKVCSRLNASSGELRSRVYKSFTTPDKNKVFAIANVRLQKTHDDGVTYGSWWKYLREQRNGTVLVHIGKPYNVNKTNDAPVNKWFRIVVPLPKNTTLEIRFVLDIRVYLALTMDYDICFWLDDFKIISKD